ncbi:hypothetical protein ID866_11479, partial [Astraeus odoratus]
MEAHEEAKKKAWEEAKQKAQEEAERKAEEECKVQEAAAARAKEVTEREVAAWRAAEAAEERADTERRALEERLWEMVGQQSETTGQWLEMAVAPLQIAKPSGRMTMAGSSTTGRRASGVQDPCTRCCNKGTLCILGAARGKTMACETDGREVINMDDKEDKEEEQSHFPVPTHLAEEHWDALRVLMTMLDVLSMDFLTFQWDSWNVSMEMLRLMGTITCKLWR